MTWAGYRVGGHSGLSGEEYDLTQDPQMGRSRHIWVSHVNSERSEKFGGGYCSKKWDILLVQGIGDWNVNIWSVAIYN